MEEFLQAGCDVYSEAAAGFVIDYESMKSVTLILTEVKRDLMPLTQNCIRLLGLSSGANGKDA